MTTSDNSSEADKRRLQADGELADIVRKAYAISLTDFPPEAEIQWLFELPMRREQGERFKKLAAIDSALSADPRPLSEGPAQSP